MIEQDQWLSKYFDGGVYKCTDASLVNNAPERAFLYVKIPTDDALALKQCIKMNFELIETALQFQQIHPYQNLGQYRDNVECFFCHDNEYIQNLLPLLPDVFHFSRFHQDAEIPYEIAEKIKRDWLLNFFQDRRGTDLILAKVQGVISGFLLLLNNQIDLIAVASNSQAKGVGSRMIAFANTHFGTLTVGTQLINKPAIRLYQKCNFKYEKSFYVFHRHGNVNEN